MSALSPVMFVRLICPRPYLTMTLFSSTRGTTSATVPSAAKLSRSSSNCCRSLGSFSPPQKFFPIIHASLKATPAPQIS